jgi:hypothetical protein
MVFKFKNYLKLEEESMKPMSEIDQNNYHLSLYKIIYGASPAQFETNFNTFLKENIDPFEIIQLSDDPSGSITLILRLALRIPHTRFKEAQVFRIEKITPENIIFFEQQLNLFLQSNSGWNILGWGHTHLYIILTASEEVATTTKSKELGFSSASEYRLFKMWGKQSKSEFEQLIAQKSEYMEKYNKIMSQAESNFAQKKYSDYIRLLYIIIEITLKIIATHNGINLPQPENGIEDQIDRIETAINKSIPKKNELTKWRRIRNQIVHEMYEAKFTETEEFQKFLDEFLFFLHKYLKNEFLFEEELKKFSSSGREYQGSHRFSSNTQNEELFNKTNRELSQIKYQLRSALLTNEARNKFEQNLMILNQILAEMKKKE